MSVIALGPLDGVLTESIEAVKRREATALDELLSANGNRCVLYGAGTLGRKAVHLLREIGAEPLAFVDSDPQRWGNEVADLSVLSPADAATRFGSSAVFFVTIWNDFHWFIDTRTKLEDLGCNAISSYAPIFWRFGARFMDLLLLNEPAHQVYEDRERVLEAESLWADKESLRTYRANIVWRALGDPSHLPYPAPRNTYFPTDIFEVSPDEVFVDCGAFDGDTLRLLLSVAPGFKAYYAIECDTTSMRRLQAYMRQLPSGIAATVKELDCAVGAERCVFKFAMSGTATSKIDSTGIDVTCIPLDELFADVPVTFIKMDIEGAEFDALRGGGNVIQRDSPVLAICLYHTQADVWRIPLLAREMLPKHKLFLRSYDGDGLQTVLFAVPPERLSLSKLASTGT